jgi:hypothetical protein|tara:strand:+ start:388 stop:906 length:519 start_codon:yes stop_codon:yes gene_type:complete
LEGEIMNRFLIDYNVDKIAKSLCDQHIVKMPLEEAQMLCTSVWHHAPEYAEEHGLYKPVHQKHPCTLWAMKCKANYNFAFRLYDSMLREYTHRYGKKHGADKHWEALFEGYEFMPDGNGLTSHPQCFSGHDELKTDEYFPVEAYRKFYIVDKSRFARYNKGRTKPDWMKEVA